MEHSLQDITITGFWGSLGSPKQKSRGTAREISGQILLSFCSSTRETAQSKESPSKLALLGCFYKAGDKEGYLKKKACGIFYVKVELLPPYVGLLSNYLPSCSVRIKMANCSLLPPQEDHIAVKIRPTLHVQWGYPSTCSLSRMYKVNREIK